MSGEKQNQRYKDVRLQVQPEQPVRTKALPKVRLIQFLPHTRKADEQALANLWQKGRETWRDVASAAEWVESLRGNK